MIKKQIELNTLKDIEIALEAIKNGADYYVSIVEEDFFISVKNPAHSLGARDSDPHFVIVVGKYL